MRKWKKPPGGKNEWWEQYQEVLSKRTDDEWSAKLKKMMEKCNAVDFYELFDKMTKEDYEWFFHGD